MVIVKQIVKNVKTHAQAVIEIEMDCPPLAKSETINPIDEINSLKQKLKDKGILTDADIAEI
jgi:hypothetical protein